MDVVTGMIYGVMPGVDIDEEDRQRLIDLNNDERDAGARPATQGGGPCA
jgi:hypothetical protein